MIHVAGTNGKGSTCAYLRAIGEAAGLRVHVLTSPHLVRFAERIRIAGDADHREPSWTALIDEVEAANAGDPISFFEMTTAIAFDAFARTPADLCVIEVGLGGRFDATNVFAHPAACVITPVDYDHLEMLGPELSKIAWEKAGIMRRGRPCFSARQPEEALAVIEAEAERVGAPLTLMGRDIDAFEEHGRLRLQLQDRLLDLPAPSLLGALPVRQRRPGRRGHPGAGRSAHRRGGHGPGRGQRGLAGAVPAPDPGAAGRPGRARGADLWLDGGHNPHAGRALAEAVRRLAARTAGR